MLLLGDETVLRLLRDRPSTSMTAEEKAPHTKGIEHQSQARLSLVNPLLKNIIFDGVVGSPYLAAIT